MHHLVLKSFDRAATPKDALRRWQGDPTTLVLAGEGQNFVYRFHHPGCGECFLRLTPDSHRTRELIDAELEFITHVEESGCEVAGPVISANRQWVETIATPAGPFHATVFWAVYGQPVRWGNDAENRRILFERGRALGRLHRGSQAFKPRRARRFAWDDDDLFRDPQAVLPESETLAHAELKVLDPWLRAGPRDEDSFGLIHGDFISANCVRSGGKTIVFDFDDCCYHWFTYDLAIAMLAGRDLPDRYRRPYLDCLLDGYATQRPLPSVIHRDIEWFTRLAAFQRYVSLIRTCDLANLTPDEQEEMSKRRRAMAEPVKWT